MYRSITFKLMESQRTGDICPRKRQRHKIPVNHMVNVLIKGSQEWFNRIGQPYPYQDPVRFYVDLRKVRYWGYILPQNYDPDDPYTIIEHGNLFVIQYSDELWFFLKLHCSTDFLDLPWYINVVPSKKEA